MSAKYLAEQRVLITVTVDAGSLLTYPEEYFEKLIVLLGAKRIDTLRTGSALSFILSESSLIVMAKSLLIVTCGDLSLESGVRFFIETHPTSTVQYEQRAVDYAKLSREKIPSSVVKGCTPCVELPYPSIRSAQSGHSPEAPPCTMLFRCLSQAEFVANLKKALVHYLPEIISHEHYFTPTGFSLNGVSDHLTLTAHLAPPDFGCIELLSFQKGERVKDFIKACAQSAGVVDVRCREDSTL